MSSINNDVNIDTGNYPFRPPPGNATLTWSDVTRLFDKPQLKRCPVQVSTMATMLNNKTRLTSTEWFTAEWKKGMCMNRILLFVENVEHEEVSYERKDGKKQTSKVTNVILSNADFQQEIKIEMVAWEQNAQRLNDNIRQGNVSIRFIV